jgi:hypothetical protein
MSGKQRPLKFSRATNMARAIGLALYAAAAAAVIAAGGPLRAMERAMHFFAHASFIYVISLSLGVSAVNAMVVVELLRIAIPSATSWNDARRLRLAAIVWAILSVCSTTAAVLLRLHLSSQGV